MRQLCLLCAARVTWYSFHSYTSDAAHLCSQCGRGRCPNVPNGHTHAAKFATDCSRQNNETKRRKQTELVCFEALLKAALLVKRNPLSLLQRSPFSKANRFTARRRHSQVYVALACDYPKASLSNHRDIGMLHICNVTTRVS